MKPVLCAVLALTAGVGLSAPLAHAADAAVTRPYLYATPADLARLNTKLGRMTLPDAGTIVLRFKPALHNATVDPDSPLIFGSFVDTAAHFDIRYLGDVKDQNKTQIQLRFVAANGTEIAKSGYIVNDGDELKLTIRYDATGAATVYSRDNTRPDITLGAGMWKPNLQKYYFAGRKNQQVLDLYAEDTSGKRVWDGKDIDWDVGASYYGLVEQFGPGLAQRVSACRFDSMPTATDDVCNVAQAGRGAITETAKQLAVAYSLSHDPIYRAAAANYVNVLLQMPLYKQRKNEGSGLAAGGEWSQGARVAALGILYDWFHDYWDDTDTNREKIRKSITDTVRADLPVTYMDLIGMICGDRKLTAAPDLACDGKPNIERNYITGHNASAMHGTLIGLLAILPDEPRVAGMVRQIYDHMVDGILPARDYISADGGHHTLFAYGSSGGEIIERLIMWQRAQAVHGLPIEPLRRAWTAKVIGPFIDATRADGTFPATGDNFDIKANDAGIGYMALAAATATNDSASGVPEERRRGIATSFYEDHVKGQRKRTGNQALWDEMYFPEQKAPRVDLKPETRDLGTHYAVAGNVFMRDTWNYAEATLLDFKSTSFSSENHQHLDQNSFSLFYRKPLLVDSGYGDYGTTHWHNYYRRTIAHNTIIVYDPAEQYSHSDSGKRVPDSNDGGQWYACTPNEALGGAAYPLLDEIQPGKRNALDGVDKFENGTAYSFVSANAGKAYLSPTKCAPRLDPADGFRRQIVYLREADKQPTIVVYDRINSPAKLPAVSLLHSVEKPATNATPVRDTEQSRYKVPGTNAPLVVRNGEGMVTIEPLLPAKAYITLAGGKPGDGSSCTDALTGKSTDDCRFTVRTADSTGQAVWRHFPIQTSQEKEPSDFGAWRIEIAPVADTSQTDFHYQYFLNVLRVAKNDNGLGAPATNTAVLLPGAGSAHAVLLDPDASDAATVVFNANFQPAASLRWTVRKDCTTTRFIAVGLVPNAAYGQRYDVNSGECVLEQGGAGKALTSSPKGVVQRL